MLFGEIFVHDTYLSIAPGAETAATYVLVVWLLVGLIWMRARLVGTTLTGPWWWTVIVTVTLGITELVLALTGADAITVEAWRFVAGVGVFCPLMSLLGAKRPQDTAWHFIVISLWGMLALPAAEGLFLRPGQPLAIIDARAWFLVGLIGLNILVMLPTRRWLAALLVGAGETCLLWSFLPWTNSGTASWQVLGGVGCFLAAFVTVTIGHRRAMASAPFDTLWLDFRDAFGALWAVRVLERVNAAAVMYDWPFRLGWNGFHAADNPSAPADISPERAKDLRQNMVNLLRRFVSTEWINARLTNTRS